MAKFAVIIRNRQAEGLRMCVGLTVLNDTVEIFITEPIKDTEDTAPHLDAIRDLKLKVYSIVPGIKAVACEHINIDTMAEKLLKYDKVLPY